MPVRPSSLAIYCSHCGWRTVVVPRSDVLIPQNFRHKYCPRCGNDNIEIRPVAGVIALIARVRRLLKIS